MSRHIACYSKTFVKNICLTKCDKDTHILCKPIGTSFSQLLIHLDTKEVENRYQVNVERGEEEGKGCFLFERVKTEMDLKNAQLRPPTMHFGSI